jgi:hypothetical protein
MYKDHIARLTVLRNTRKGILNILFRWRMVLSVIHENEHFRFVESVHLGQEFNNILDVVVATRQLPLLSSIVDSNQNGTFPTRRGGWDNSHGRVDVDQSRAGELRYLVEPHAVEGGAHLTETLDPGEFPRSNTIVVEDL